MTMSTATNQWIPSSRDYEAERKATALKLESTANHPLLPRPDGIVETKSPSLAKLTSVTKLPSTTSLVTASPLSVDPLSSSGELSFDPLKGGDDNNNNKVSSGVGGQSKEVSESVDPTFVPWSAMKPGILQTYTTDEQIGITVTFMNTAGTQKVKAPVDKMKNRLEQLDQEEDGTKETLQLTQKDYVNHIESLHKELTAAWDSEERVKALKLAIQCAKLLTDVTVIKFYPSKFVLVTEILDTFGTLVYERIKRRSAVNDNVKAKSISERFTNEQINEQAKETCRNWFYKIASIRELVPRIYVEMAIIKCYEFLKGDRHTDYEEVVDRIGNMIRGIGNPLIAAYAKTYLARKAHEVVPSAKNYLLRAFEDHLTSHKQTETERFKLSLEEQKLTRGDYLSLYSPALEWLLQCIAHNNDRNTLEFVIEKYRESKSALILNHIISSFHPDFISSKAHLITTLIREADESSYPKHLLYRSLGANLVLGKPPQDQVIPILNDVWKVVTKLENVSDYMAVAEVWIEYPLKHCSTKEVNILLRDILRHVSADRAYESLQPHLQSVIHKILTYLDFSVIVSLENFLPLLDLFGGEIQVQISKSILENFTKFQGVTSDPVIISTMFAVGKTVHDSVNSLSIADEVRQVSQTILSFINKIDFGRNLEKHLQFYVDCRQAFANMDNVKSRLVTGVLQLAMRTFAIVKGNHSKKTASFARACLAYCYITIPCMEDLFGRLNLYILAGGVAMMNGSMPQSDGFLKAAITLVQEVPIVLEVDAQVKSTEEPLLNFLQNFLSLLVVLPGHPEHGPFYLTKGLLKVVKDYTWEKGSSGKARVLNSLLSLYSTYYQSSLPYHIEKLDSNDVLYAGDSDFVEELLVNINKTLEELLEDVNKMKDDVDPQIQRKSGRVALDLYNNVIANAEINAKSATLAYNLFSIAKKTLTSQPDAAYLKNSLQYTEALPSKMGQELVKKLKAL